MIELTGPQRRVLELIETLLHERGMPPTQRELAERYGCHYRSLQRHLERLRRKGRVTWEEGVPRSLRILQPPAPGSVQPIVRCRACRHVHVLGTACPRKVFNDDLSGDVL